MALIKSVRGFQPEFGENCYFAETACIIGQVVAGDACSFWFNAVVRGDVSPIKLGHRVNVQDGALIHATYQRSETIIGDQVSIAHNAIVHGCTIEENVLIGMGAIVMDGVVIESGSIIGAGSVVLQNTKIGPGQIWVGNPAKYLKDTNEYTTREIERIAQAYPKYASWYGEQMGQ